MLIEILSGALLALAQPPAADGAVDKSATPPMDAAAQACRVEPGDARIELLVEAHARGWARLPLAPQRPAPVRLLSSLPEKDTEQCRS